MKKMSYLQSFEIFERLIVSEDVSHVLFALSKESIVARLLFQLVNDDTSIYKDEEEINFIELAEELNKFSFIPKKRRNSKVSWEINFDRKSMPTRIGKIVNKIYNKVKKALVYEEEVEITVMKSGSIFIILDENCYFPFLFDDTLLEQQKYGKCEIDLLGYYESDGNYIEYDTPVSYNMDLYGWRLDYDNYTTYTKPPTPGRRVYRYAAELIFGPDFDAFVSSDKATGYDAETNKINISEPSNFQAKVKLVSNIKGITDADVEDFVNKAVAYIKTNRADSSAVIQEVRGEKIRHWYNRENYKSTKGQLGNSCMSYAHCQSYLDIYCENKEVSLLILLNEDKLIARALLWELDGGGFFVDRCYSIFDSDVEIFYEWAKKKGYYYNKNGAIYFDSKPSSKRLLVSLTKCKFQKYPYLDTLKYLDTNTGTLTNSIISLYGTNYRVLQDTDGSFTYYDNDEYWGDDDDDE